MNFLLKILILALFASCNILTDSSTKIDKGFLDKRDNSSASNSFSLSATGSTSYGEYGGGQSTFINNHLDAKTLVSSPKTFIKVVSHQATNCALSSDKKIYCWGKGSQGLGDGNAAYHNVATPSEIIGGHDFSDISGGGDNTCGITTPSGDLYCWGTNTYGQLGQGNTIASAVPVQITHGNPWFEVSVGTNKVCAIDSSSALYCWGQNNYGQLGVGDTAQRSSPVQVSGSWLKVEISMTNTCAINTSNVLFCWGGNLSFQTGTGASTADIVTPSAVSTSKTWISITVDNYVTCAIDNLNDLYCAGTSSNGDFGSYVDGSPSIKNAHTEIFPGTDWVSVEKRGWGICATDTSNQLHCWGRNYFGMFGLGNTTFLFDTPQPIMGRAYSNYSIGNTHMCAIASSDQKLHCWGDSSGDKLGNGIDYSLNTYFKDYISTVEFSKIESGNEYSCGIGKDQKLYCWGRNDFGQLGLGHKNPEVYPIEVMNGKLWLDVGVSSSTTCGVTTLNELFCWGNNSTGQLGDGSTTKSSTPIKLAGVDSWAKVATSAFGHTCAVKTSGELFCWGDNSSRQLGQNTTTNIPTPVQVQSGTDWDDVALSNKTSCAIKTTGDIYCFGEGGTGEIGNGANTDQGLPVPITSVANHVSLVESYGGFCALTDSDQIICWGAGSSGQLGNGGVSNQNNPVSVSLSENFKSVHSGANSYGVCGITRNDDAFCWGKASEGQLGDGTMVNKATPTQVGVGKIWINLSVGAKTSIGIVKNN